MKNLMLKTILPFLFTAMLFGACQKDPCETTVCLNGGTCSNGSCLCPAGFSGSDCGTQDLCYGINCYNGGTCANGVCNCPPGYSGSDCSTVLTPTSMTITKIVVTQYPTTQANGAGWDLADGADAYVTFNSGTSANSTGFVSGRYTDVTGQSLTYTTGLPRTATSVTSNYVLGLWDYDATSNDDFMTGVYFTPISQSTGFPSTFQVTTSSITATLHVTWNF